MKRPQTIGITRILAIAGLTDFKWVDEESKWRGSEVHRIVQLASTGTLDRKSVPKVLAGYAEAHRKFLSETGFIALAKYVECNVEDKLLGIRGRIDAAGVIGGAPAIVDYKTSKALNPAVALQLALGAHLLEPGKHRLRFAVQLGADGGYKMKKFPVLEFAADLATALAAARIARWKIQHNLA